MNRKIPSLQAQELITDILKKIPKGGWYSDITYVYFTATVFVSVLEAAAVLITDHTQRNPAEFMFFNPSHRSTLITPC